MQHIQVFCHRLPDSEAEVLEQLQSSIATLEIISAQRAGTLDQYNS